MKNLFKITTILAVLTYALHAEVYKTVSPDNNIVISFKLDAAGTPSYTISYKGTTFLNWSNLGLIFLNSEMFSQGLEIISVERKEIDETYPLIAGKSKYSRNYCSETRIVLQEKAITKRTLELYFRAYNDGAAFRYGIPEQSSVNRFIISSEETKFNFAGDYTCWALKRLLFISSYEGEYLKYNLSNLFFTPGDSLKDFPLCALPLTMEVNPNLYICLSEANITDYAGMYLVKGQERYSLKSKLSPDTTFSDISVRGKSPAVSPWRVFIIGERPGDLIESNLIKNLNEPNKIPDAEFWVKSGKSTWSWWAEDRGFDANFGFNIISTNTVKYYIDFSAQNSIEYYTIDGGWYGWFDATKGDAMHDVTKSQPELDLPGVAAYANSKGVGLFLWVVWFELERQMEQALDYYQKIGIKGVKVDFMDRDDQYMVDFYHTIARECAKRKILVNFHGAYKPDGLERTYPNILTREAVLGSEWSRNPSGLPDPNYNVTLPFTRMITGGMDFTPGSMTNSTKEAYIGRWKNPMTKGTRTQQMAMLVVYESGIITLCESPKIYERLPEFEFIKNVPASWDSTIVLDGKIGDYIAIARKKGGNWYLGAMTDWNERDLEIDFGFLSGRTWSADIYSDAPDANTNPSNVSMNKTIINNNDIKSFHLAKGGGLAIILRK